MVEPLKRGTFVSVSLAVLAGSVAAQVLETAQGRIEFVGLRSWTPEALDAANTERCKAHWCAANLEGELGFAEAAVFTLGRSAEVAKLVVVVEDRALVRRKPAPEGEGEVPAGWRELVKRLEGDGSMALDLALRNYPPLLEGGAETARAELAKLDWAADQVPLVEAVWTFLQQRSTPADLAVALWHLEKNASVDARRLAAAQLISFPAHDVTWWALADGMRDPEDRVNGVCWSVLRQLAQHAARPVDWRPAVPALRALLAGTHCFGLPDLCEALARTEIDPALAPALLADGADLLFALADAHPAFARTRTRALLAHLTGEHEEAPSQRFKDRIR